MYVDPDGEWFFEALTYYGGLIGGLYEGIRSSFTGQRSFIDGFASGFVDGAKIGGSIGIVADIITGGTSSYSQENPVYTSALSTYIAAWNGQAGIKSPQINIPDLKWPTPGRISFVAFAISSPVVPMRDSIPTLYNLYLNDPTFAIPVSIIVIIL